MGQPIAVTEKPGARGGVIRFDLNRSITGMGHVRHRAGSPVEGDTPADELARRLLDTGRVAAVHSYMSVVTVEMQPGASSDGLREIVEGLYRYYDDDGGVVGADAEAAPEADPATDADAAPEAD